MYLYNFDPTKTALWGNTIHSIKIIVYKLRQNMKNMEHTDTFIKKKKNNKTKLLFKDHKSKNELTLGNS